MTAAPKVVEGNCAWRGSAMVNDPRYRFILSKGHAAIGLYPVLADLGFFDPALLDEFTRLGSAFGDHPDMSI